MQMEGIIAEGQVVALHFYDAQAAASQAAANMKALDTFNGTTNSDHDADGIVVPFNFSVIGISVRSSAARTGGTLTVDAAIDGTATGVQAALNATDTQSAYARKGRQEKTGSAGSRVGCKITTDATWAPATADVVATVWVLVELEAI